MLIDYNKGMNRKTGLKFKNRCKNYVQKYLIFFNNNFILLFHIERKNTLRKL